MRQDPYRELTLSILCMLLFPAGLALLANEAPAPASINTSGMGPFRLLTDDSVLGNPRVIELQSGAFLMYLDDEADVRRARSSDGLRFTLDAEPVDPTIAPGNESEVDIVEIAYLAPGTIVATTAAGREVVRPYAEVQGALPVNGRGDDRLVIAAASLDGVTFSRTRLPALNTELLVENRRDVFALRSPTRASSTQVRRFLI